MRDTGIGSNLGGGMSSSGTHKLLWFISHTFGFQSCGSQATTAPKSTDGQSGCHKLRHSGTMTYTTFFAAQKYGRGFAELGVVPQVRLERP